VMNGHDRAAIQPLQGRFEGPSSIIPVGPVVRRRPGPSAPSPLAALSAPRANRGLHASLAFPQTGV